VLLRSFPPFPPLRKNPSYAPTVSSRSFWLIFSAFFPFPPALPSPLQCTKGCRVPPPLLSFPSFLHYPPPAAPIYFIRLLLPPPPTRLSHRNQTPTQKTTPKQTTTTTKPKEHHQHKKQPQPFVFFSIFSPLQMVSSTLLTGPDAGLLLRDFRS